MVQKYRLLAEKFVYLFSRSLSAWSLNTLQSLHFSKTFSQSLCKKEISQQFLSGEWLLTGQSTEVAQSIILQQEQLWLSIINYLPYSDNCKKNANWQGTLLSGLLPAFFPVVGKLVFDTGRLSFKVLFIDHTPGRVLRTLVRIHNYHRFSPNWGNHNRQKRWKYSLQQ